MGKESEVFDNIMKDWSDADNPLKDTFLIKVKNIEEIKQTATSIKEIKGVVAINYGEGMIEQLINTFKIVEKVAFGVVIALVIVTIFLILDL